jgi:putative membrane protein
MIKYNPKNWFALIFEFHKSDTLRKLLKTIIIFSLYSIVLLYLEIHYTSFKSTIAIHSLLGFVLGLLLVFRTNTAYDRWWEGRRIWGELTNTSRNLAMKINAVLKEDNLNDREFYASMISNFAISSKNHLRTNEENYLNGISNCSGFNKKNLKSKDHIPNIISSLIFKKTHDLFKEDIITGNILITIDKQIKTLVDVIGGCERIKNTPIPYSYNIFLKKFIFIYTLSLPFGLVSDLGYWAVPISVFILYVLCSLELLAEEIEDPFGKDANDLPLDVMCENIKENVNSILLNKYAK